MSKNQCQYNPRNPNVTELRLQQPAEFALLYKGLPMHLSITLYHLQNIFRCIDRFHTQNSTVIERCGHLAFINEETPIAPTRSHSQLMTELGPSSILQRPGQDFSSI